MNAARARGFTLIEVMVALIIVALGMGAVMAALTTSAESTLRLRDKACAGWIGLNQLATTRLARGTPANGKSEGDVDYAGGRWHWVQQVSAMQVPGVLRIEVQVRKLAGAAREEGDQASAAAAGANAAAEAARSTPANDPPDWLATVTGFRGDAIASPQGSFASWDTPPAQGNPGGNAGNPAAGAPTTGTPAPVPVTQATPP